jgi:hypothetical protein
MPLLDRGVGTELRRRVLPDEPPSAISTARSTRRAMRTRTPRLRRIDRIDARAASAPLIVGAMVAVKVVEVPRCVEKIAEKGAEIPR